MRSAPHAAVLSDDVELVRRALTRDDTAFRTIMERHNRRLYRIARSILRNDSEAEDAVQEAYVNAFTHLGGFRGDSTLATWLSHFRSATNRGSDHQIPSNGDIRRSGTNNGAAGNSAACRASDRQATRDLSNCVHDTRDRRDERRGNRGASWSSAGDCENAAASRASARARGIRQANRPRSDGRVSVRRQALRARDQRRSATDHTSQVISGNFSTLRSSNQCQHIGYLRCRSGIR